MSISASLLIFPPSPFSRRITRSSSERELRAPNLSNFSRDPSHRRSCFNVPDSPRLLATRRRSTPSSSSPNDSKNKKRKSRLNQPGQVERISETHKSATSQVRQVQKMARWGGRVISDSERNQWFINNRSVAGVGISHSLSASLSFSRLPFYSRSYGIKFLLCRCWVEASLPEARRWIETRVKGVRNERPRAEYKVSFERRLDGSRGQTSTCRHFLPPPSYIPPLRSSASASSSPIEKNADWGLGWPVPRSRPSKRHFDIWPDTVCSSRAFPTILLLLVLLIVRPREKRLEEKHTVIYSTYSLLLFCAAAEWKEDERILAESRLLLACSGEIVDLFHHRIPDEIFILVAILSYWWRVL